MEKGYIKFFRKILEWEWYDDANTFRVFFHLLITANYIDKSWRGRIIKRGQVVIGTLELSKKLGMTRQMVRTSLSKLKLTNEITNESTSDYTVVTIKNYEKYQGATNEITNDQPTINQRVTTTNNIKNIRNKETSSTKNEAEGKQINSLSLTRGQLIIFAREFPGLSTEEIKEESRRCSASMAMSSSNYSNPGLYFKGWLKKIVEERRKTEALQRVKDEALTNLPVLTEEQIKKNREKLAEIQSRLKSKFTIN